MAPRTVRTTKTGSGGTAVQVVERRGGKTIVHEHMGTAHTEEDVLALRTLAYQRVYADESVLVGFEELVDLDPTPKRRTLSATHVRSYSGVLFDALAGVYDLLGFQEATGGDKVFRQLVIARIIEPTSKLDTLRVLADLGLAAPSNTSVHRSLKRVVEREYRKELAKHCLATRSSESLTLVLYDVTTLYFQIDREDDYRKPGLSKERRLEPQIVVGLLVDRHGFPLAVDSFEGNTAETKTIRPVLHKFREQHPGVKVTVVADAAMLSVANLTELEAAGYGFVVGSRITRTPYEIAEYTSGGQTLTDGQIFDTRTPMAGPAGKRVKRRIVYQYREKRARMDLKNIDTLVAKAEAIIDGRKPLKKNRFLAMDDAEHSLNKDLIASARQRTGIKGYVTNLDESAQFIIDAYHQLFNVEASFRMSKSDLRARPIHHQLRDKIEAHLTIVFAALAISRWVQEATELSIKKFVKSLTPLRTAIIRIGTKEYTAHPEIPSDEQATLEKIRNPKTSQTHTY